MSSKERCDAIAPADEYCHAPTRCELAKGHGGQHYAQLSATSSRCWEDVTFQINYMKEANSER